MGSSILEEVVVVSSIERWMMLMMEEVGVRLLMVCGPCNFSRFMLKLKKGNFFQREKGFHSIKDLLLL